ncbi:hypothetical protein DOY81_008804, partial [Sarcophaga bullata]
QADQDNMTSPVDKLRSPTVSTESCIQESADEISGKTEELISEAQSESKPSLPIDEKIIGTVFDKGTLLPQVTDDPTKAMSGDKVDKHKMTSLKEKPSSPTKSMESCIQESVDKISSKTEELISETESEKKPSPPIAVKTKGADFENTLIPQESGDPKETISVDKAERDKLTPLVEKQSTPLDSTESCIQESDDRISGKTEELISETESEKKASLPEDVKTKEIEFDNATLIPQESGDPKETINVDKADEDKLTQLGEKQSTPVDSTESCIQEFAENISDKTKELISETESEKKPSPPIAVKTKETEFDNAILIPQGSEETTKIRTLDQTDKGKLTSPVDKPRSNTRYLEEIFKSDAKDSTDSENNKKSDSIHKYRLDKEKLGSPLEPTKSLKMVDKFKQGLLPDDKVSLKPYSDDDSEDENQPKVSVWRIPVKSLGGGAPVISELTSQMDNCNKPTSPTGPIENWLEPYSDENSDEEVLLNPLRSPLTKPLTQFHDNKLYYPVPQKPYSDDDSEDDDFEISPQSLQPKFFDKRKASLKSLDNDNDLINESGDQKLAVHKPDQDVNKFKHNQDNDQNLQNHLNIIKPKIEDIFNQKSLKAETLESSLVSKLEDDSLPLTPDISDSISDNMISKTDNKSHAVAYFVNLEEGEKNKIQSVTGFNTRKQLYGKNKSKTAKSNTDIKIHDGNKKFLGSGKKSFSKTSSISEKPLKSKTPNIYHTTQNKLISKETNVDNAITHRRVRKDNKNLATKDYERLISDKTKISAINNQIRLERTLSSQSSQTFSEKTDFRSRSTTPRPRVRTDITKVPQQQVLREFSPPNHPKVDYSSITSSYAYSRKTSKTTKTLVKKPTERSPSSRSSTPNDDSQRSRLRTPTMPSTVHHYMQPTIAHSRRYSNLKPTNSEHSLDDKSSRSPVPPLVTTSKRTSQSKQRKPQVTQKNLHRNQFTNSRESVKTIEPIPKAIAGSQKKSTDDNLKPFRTQQLKDKSHKNTTDKSISSTKSVIVGQVSNRIGYARQVSKSNLSSKETLDKQNPIKRERTSKLFSADSNKVKSHETSSSKTTSAQTKRSIGSSKAAIKSGSTFNNTYQKSADRVSKKEIKAKIEPKISNIKQETTKRIEPKDKLGKGTDPKAQKKLKNITNNHTGSVTKIPTQQVQSSNNSRKSTSKTSTKTNATARNIQSTNKLDKELLNTKLAEKKTFTTTVTSPGISRISTVKLHREPIATTLVNTVVINDDNDSENNTRSVRSNESMKSSSSSSGSRKVITSEVFTKTFGPDKPFEVIYRQPDVDYMSIMRPQSVEQRCVNEYDVSFIDTTDSSLSDSVALPTFTSDQERLCAASPGSPKPTRSPFALIEETIRKQQVDGFALDPTLQKQIEAVGIISSQAKSPLTSSLPESNLHPKQ